MPSLSIALDSFATFGDLLKFLRRRARLTQLELSIAVGYSEAQISCLEKNLRLPDLTAIKALFIPALHLEHDPETTTHLLALAESARQEDAPLPGVAPYKGLLFFDEADADLFFGREALTAHLVEHVQALDQQRPRLLAIVGASGSGKSSVVRAGLAVALKRAGWAVRVFTPTAHPMKMLEAHFTHETVPLLLIVDQFEEVFTLCRDETARTEFIKKLLTAANESNGQITIVFALRADFYSHCAQYPQLRQAIAAHQEYIGQMTREELRRAIEEPAKRGGWEFEAGLVDLMLSDVGAGSTQDQEPGALPLLSHALLATWEHRRGRTFTLAGYRAAGGVRRAIAETAESVFTDQLNQQQQHWARDIFLRLTELGEGTEDTRRRAGLNELVPRVDEATQLRAVLNTLAEARLVMLGEDSAEVAHEALIREWSRLREWLNENREALRLHRHLTEAAQAWARLNRDDGELYRGARLAQALEWTRGDTLELNHLECEFLGSSQEMVRREEAEREAQRQRELKSAKELAETQTRAAQQLRKRAVFLAGTLLVALVLAVAAIWFAQQSSQNEQAAIAQKGIAENERRIAFVRELSVNAVNNLDIDPERSILLALQAVSVSTAGGKPVLREAEEALHRAVQKSRAMLTLTGHTGVLQSVNYSPDGKLLVTASLDKTAKIWDASTGKNLLTVTGHNDGVRGAAFSPDGTRIATASDDKTVKMWEAATGKELLTLSGHTDPVWSVAFSPDGTRLATGSRDKTAKLWNATTGKELFTLSGHTGALRRAIAFSPDGKRLVTVGEDKMAKVWDTATGRELLTFSGHTNAIWGVAFSPAGTHIATTSIDGTTKVWDSTSGRQLLNLASSSSINTVAFNTSGTYLATGGGDGTARIWDTATGQMVLELYGHTGAIDGVAFSRDLHGMRLITAAGDSTAKVWDISPSGNRDWLTLANHVGRVRDIASSPDGKFLATAGADKTAKVWDQISGKELFTLRGHTNELRSVAFSPDGKRLATSSDDQTAKVWDVSAALDVSGSEQATRANAIPTLLTLSTNATVTGLADHTLTFSPDGTHLVSASAGNTAKVWSVNAGEELFTLSGHTHYIQAAVFSPDGKRLVTVSQDKTAKVWDAATGKELFTINAHAGPIYGLAFSRDGTRIATGSSDGTAKVWDATDGKELFTLSGFTGVILGVSFSPDGTHLVTASGDSSIKLWNISQSKIQNNQPLNFYGHTAAVYGAVFSPDGKRLATASRDGTARVYALPLEDIIAIAKSRVTRSLTTDECQKFLHTDQCPAETRLDSNIAPRTNP